MACLSSTKGTLHLSGILGAGMSALARLLLERGYRVSGSDVTVNDRLQPLRALGVRVSLGEVPSDLTSASLVIHSAAIPAHHPDLVRARALGVPIVSRARALATLLQGQEVIVVSGSHGKTTTTAMLAFLLVRAGLNPGYMIGDVCPCLEGRHAHWSGQGPFINESCEAFRALDFWNPSHCIVTNIDDEHSEHYGTFEKLKKAFADLVRRVPGNGKILLCSHDPSLQAIKGELGDHAEDYGLNHGAVWRADVAEIDARGTTFNLFKHGTFLTSVRLPVVGQHNVLNAVAAIAMATRFGVSTAQASQCLALFQPPPRRWQNIGSWSGVQLYDDMAHHPREIAATLDVARQTATPEGRVIAVCQPQLVSRVERLASDYVSALGHADAIILLPLDHGGCRRSKSAARDVLADLLRAKGINPWEAETVQEASLHVTSLARQGDLVVTMGPALAYQCSLSIQEAFSRPEICRRESSTADRSSSATRYLQDWFLHQARRQPDAPCLLDGERIRSYGDIFEQANRVAHRLTQRGLGRGDLVVLVLAKSGRFIALVLGALMAGCAFVPVDPAMRRASLHQHLHQMGIGLLIEDSGSSECLISALPSISIDDFWAELGRSPISNSIPLVSGESLAYAIFTSGTSGAPRLVGVSHNSICSLIDYSTRCLFEPADLALTPFIDSISFDASIHQIFSTLSSGGCLLLAADLTELLRSEPFERITSLGGTPSVIARLEATRQLPETLRVISLGGEVVPARLIKSLTARQGLRKLYNFYGPTETTIFSTVAEPKPGHSGKNIGFPIDGTRVYLVDPDDEPVNDGCTGEIIIAGNGVAQGYLGDAQSTLARFTPDPFDESTVAQVFRTGDLGRRLADGSIEFLGRMDDQIKIHGVRIDPVEIEIQLEAMSGIDRAAVVPQLVANETSRLAAFVVAKDGTDLDLIRAQLLGRLPAIMVPHTLTRVDALPMSKTGKLSRRELGLTAAEFQSPSEPPLLLDGIERSLLSIWQDVLQCPGLQANDNFFERGGDSLALMQLVLTVEKTFGLRLTAMDIETISDSMQMASIVRSKLSDPKSLCSPPADLTSRILGRQRIYLAAWDSGCERTSEFVRSLGSGHAQPGLFWIFQGFKEFHSLASALGEALPIHGLRSGHLIMEYMPDTIAALALQYSEELIQCQPDGPILLGGNCQGATIARVTAQALRARGREVRRLILMEQPSLWPSNENVGLIFGRSSSHNPYLKMPDPGPTLRRAYPQGFDFRLTEGRHGSFFTEQNVLSLAAAIQSLV